MAVAGDVVFSRDLEDANNLWDDTALIKAYDEAVSNMKADLAEKMGGDSEVDATPDLPETFPNKKKHKKNRRKHKKKDKAAGSGKATSFGRTSQIKPGSHCRAVYTEDGEIYEAVILSINSESQNCHVRYLGYGNEEDQAIMDLLPSKEFSSARSDAASECDSMDWSPHGSSHRTTPTPVFKVPLPHGPGQQRTGAGRGWMPPPPPFSMGAMGTDFTIPPLMPPLFPPTIGIGLPSFGHMQHQMGMPEMPMPPPLEDDDTLENDKEALHSMLLAWYMSGYHTGYYQGLKQGKKSAKDNNTAKCSVTETQSETDDAR